MMEMGFKHKKFGTRFFLTIYNLLQTKLKIQIYSVGGAKILGDFVFSCERKKVS